MGKYFGTDGFRGETNKLLTADHAYKIGRFLGWYCNRKRIQSGQHGRARIVIGKDTRLSGYMLEYILSGAIASSGADAYLLHVTTTPCVAFVTKGEEFDCGIMISASHNPFYDNGIKLFNNKGEKMQEEVISLLEAYLDGSFEQEVPFAERENIGRCVDFAEGRSRYIGHLASLGKYSLEGKRLALDCANGGAWKIAEAVFTSLGARVFLTGAEPDGTNINLAAGSTDTEKLRSLVLKNDLDAGFAFDGDADRCIAVDEKGNIVDGDAILYIYGKLFKERGTLNKNTVVTTVMSNFGLFKALDESGIDYVKTKVGDRYVYEYIREHGCSIGGEQSGHIIFSQYSTTGDGILTAVMLSEAMISEKKKLSELREGFTAYPQTLINVRVSDKEEALGNIGVRRAYALAEKALEGRGRILLRKSGTEPVVRVMTECSDERLCQSCAKVVGKALENAEKEKGKTQN